MYDLSLFTSVLATSTVTSALEFIFDGYYYDRFTSPLPSFFFFPSVSGGGAVPFLTACSILSRVLGASFNNNTDATVNFRVIR